jgi:hypothetical protein
MRRPLLPLLLLFAAVVGAEERWVPLAPGSTEVELTNSGRVPRVVIVGGERIVLEGRERRREIVTSEGAGALRVDADPAVMIAATAHARDAAASLPVGDARDAVEDVLLEGRGSWRSGVVVVNPGDRNGVVTIDRTVHVIAADGVLHVPRASRLDAASPLLVFAYDANDVSGMHLFRIAPHASSRKRRAVHSPEPLPVKQTVVLTPSKDNTLFETTNGATSNAIGVHLFAGTTQGASKRRAVLAFDIASLVPPGSRISRVSLAMTVSMTIAGTQPVNLHRLNSDWGEGNSDAGSGRDGAGISARPGDATWIHTFSPDRRWTTAGGDFEAAADATAQVASATGVWESAAMIARVQQWLDQPASNRGWIVIGNETRATTAKRFDSREAPNASSRPSLTIEFQR